MNIIYNRLLELQMTHPFFADGMAKALKLLPTSETQSLLKRGRMLMRDLPSGLVLLYKSQDESGSPEVSLTPNTDFYFFLFSENPSQFFTITDLKEGSRALQQGEIISFGNDPSSSSTDDANPEKITLKIWDGIKPKAFVSRVQLSPIPAQVLLQVRDSTGTLISSGTDDSGTLYPLNRVLEPDSAGVFDFAVNLENRAEGNYSLTLRDAGDTTDLWNKTYFLTNNSFGNKAIGVVKISYIDGQNTLYGSQEYFALDLKGRETKWKYFVISQNTQVDLSSAKVSIKDKGNPPGSNYGVYDFDQIGSAPNADVKINDQDTVIFKSQDTIPFFETPKLNLELRRKPGNRVLLKHLPNPISTGITKVEPGEEISEIYVYI